MNHEPIQTHHGAMGKKRNYSASSGPSSLNVGNWPVTSSPGQQQQNKITMMGLKKVLRTTQDLYHILCLV